MFPISLPNSSHRYSDRSEAHGTSPISDTVFLYANQMVKGYFRRGIESIRRKSTQLADLNAFLHDHPVQGSHYEGVHSVSVEQIRGSEGRKNDFDRFFNPIHERTRSRWMSVARARLAGKELPPVELIQVGDEYFVRDGHHRISVARALGERYLDARITKFEVLPVRQELRLS
jgi:hypothetical protein